MKLAPEQVVAATRTAVSPPDRITPCTCRRELRAEDSASPESQARLQLRLAAVSVLQSVALHRHVAELGGTQSEGHQQGAESTRCKACTSALRQKPIYVLQHTDSAQSNALMQSMLP